MTTCSVKSSLLSVSENSGANLPQNRNDRIDSDVVLSLGFGRPPECHRQTRHSRGAPFRFAHTYRLDRVATELFRQMHHALRARDQFVDAFTDRVWRHRNRCSDIDRATEYRVRDSPAQHVRELFGALASATGQDQYQTVAPSI